MSRVTLISTFFSNVSLITSQLTHLISLEDSISLALFVIALMSTRNYTNVIFGKFGLLRVDSSPASDWSQTLLNSPSYWPSVTLPTFLVMRGLACYHGTPLYLSVSEIMKSSESNVTQCCHSRPPALTGEVTRCSGPGLQSDRAQVEHRERGERNQGTCHH